jgi:hypothetical protein
MSSAVNYKISYHGIDFCMISSPFTYLPIVPNVFMTPRFLQKAKTESLANDIEINPLDPDSPNNTNDHSRRQPPVDYISGASSTNTPITHLLINCSAPVGSRFCYTCTPPAITNGGPPPSLCVCGSLPSSRMRAGLAPPPPHHANMTTSEPFPAFTWPTNNPNVDKHEDHDHPFLAWRARIVRK